MSPLFQLVYSTAYSLDESLIPTGVLLIPWMSPLFQLVYSTAYSLDEFLIPTGFIQQLSYSTAYSLDEYLIPTGFIQQLSYSTAYSLDEYLIPTGFIQQLSYSLDESLIPTGFIQLFIPMAALIWSHFLFNNWFYSTTVLFSTFYSDGCPYLVALFIQQLVLFNNCFILNFLFRWLPLFGRTFYSTTGFIQQLFYSQLFIPMAALIWSHFLFNNWFYSTTVLLATLIWSHFLFNFLFYSTCPYSYFIPCLITTDLLFFFFFGKKGVLPGFEPGTS